MKNFLAMTTAVLLIFPVAATYAVDAHHPGKQDQRQSMPNQQGGGMMMGKMQTHMKKMMQQMDEIRKTEDPDKRDKLIEAHMKSMQEGMKMMGGMGGGMMMGKQQEGNMGGGKMMGKQQEGKMGGDKMMGKQQEGKMGGDMAMRMDGMEQRMDMMQMMMDQMIQSQDAVEETRKMHNHRKTHK